MNKNPSMGLEIAQRVLKKVQVIPALPLVRTKILQLTSDATASPAEVAEVIESDPSFTARVLKIVNTHHYGHRYHASTLSHAVTLLGTKAVRTMVLNTSIFHEYFNEKTRGIINKSLFWQHSLATGIIAKALAELLNYDLPEEGYLAGLLHDIGKICLEIYSPEKYSLVVKKARKNASTIELERQILGTDHTQVGAILAERWNFSEFLTNVIRHHHDETEQGSDAIKGQKNYELISIVSMADFMSWTQGMGLNTQGPIPNRRSSWEKVQALTEDNSPAILDKVKDKLTRIASMFAIPLQNPGELFTLFDKMNHSAGAGPEHLLGKAAGSRKFHEVKVLSQIIKRIRKEPSAPDIISKLVEEVHKHLDFDRVVFLEFQKDDHKFQGKIVLDETSLKVVAQEIQFFLERGEETLSLCFERPGPYLVNDPRRDPEILSYFGVEELGIAPLKVNGEISGIICADNFCKERPISQKMLNLLGLLTLEAGMVIENILLSKKAKKLKEFAEKDELTELNNRRYGLTLFKREIDRAKRYNGALSALMVDVDHFKRYNDLYGHQVGDIILKKVARLLRENTRKMDILSRYGGDEFIIFLPETTSQNAIVLAERLRTLVENLGHSLLQEYPLCQLSASVGVTSLEDGKDTLESLLSKVDRALYAAKRRGRNRVCID